MNELVSLRADELLEEAKEVVIGNEEDLKKAEASLKHIQKLASGDQKGSDLNKLDTAANFIKAAIQDYKDLKSREREYGDTVAEEKKIKMKKQAENIEKAKKQAGKA